MPRLILECDAPTADALITLLHGHPGVTVLPDLSPARSPGTDAVLEGQAAQSSDAAGDPPPDSDRAGRPEWCVDPRAPHLLPLPVPLRLRQEHLTVFTDGSCRGNPGPTGLAVIVHEAEKLKVGFAWGGGQGTNNTAELGAVLSALNLAVQRRAHAVTVTTDSEYVFKNVEKWQPLWRAGKLHEVANRALWDKVLAVKTALEEAGVGVTVQWTRGHDGHPLNERADKLAVTACKTQRYHREDYA